MSEMKKTEGAGTARCRNETCPRPAEPGDVYCEECGLERSLFLRDRREREEIRTARPHAEAPR